MHLAPETIPFASTNETYSTAFPRSKHFIGDRSKYILPSGGHCDTQQGLPTDPILETLPNYDRRRIHQQ